MAAVDELKFKVSADVAGAVNGLKQVDNQLTKTAGTVKKSGKNFTEFGRVIQDLPFGFQGIQNNLTQVIPSVGGLGLAFSGLVAAMTFSQVGFGAWTRMFGLASKESEELKQRLEDLLVPVSQLKDGLVAGAEAELAQVQVLARVVTDQTETYKRRNAALNELKDINKSYFGDLTLEESKLGAVKKAVDEYTQAIIQQSVIKSFGDEIGKVAVELSRQEKAFSKLGAAARQAKKDREGKNGDDYFFQSIEINDATSAYNKQAKVVGQLRNQMGELRKAIADAVGISLDLKPLDTDTPKKVKEVKEKVDKLIKDNFRSFIAPEFGIPLRFTVELAQLKAQMDVFDTASKKILKEKLEAKGPIPLRVNIVPDVKVPELSDLQKSLESAVTNIAVGAFSGIGEALAAAVSGDNIGGAFQNLFNVIGSAIQDLGRSMIAFSSLMRTIQAAIRGLDPTGGIIAGVALVALGGIMKNFKPKGFATGGVIPPGFPNDSYYARLTSGERVLTPSQNKEWEGRNLGRAATMAFPDYLPVFRMTANEWMLMYERFNKSAGRTN
jgi:hypothetical protein